MGKSKIIYCLTVQSVVHRPPAAAAAPKSLLETQNLRSHSRLTESESGFLTRFSDDSYAH